MAVALAAVALLALGWSPGVALIIVATAIFVLDAHDPRILDSITRAFADE